MSDDHHLVASEEGEDAHAGGVRQQPGAWPPESEPTAATSEAGHRRAENWLVQEARYLRIRVEDLEGRLRQRMFALVSALTAAGLLAATAAALAVVLTMAPLRGPEPPPATSKAAPAHEAPEEAPPVIEVGHMGAAALAAGYATDGTALRAALAVAGERIAELEAAGAYYQTTITELRAELEDARAEARTRGILPEASRRGVEDFNALLAAMLAGDGGRGDGGEGRQASPHEAGGPSRP